MSPGYKPGSSIPQESEHAEGVPEYHAVMIPALLQSAIRLVHLFPELPWPRLAPRAGRRSEYFSEPSDPF